MADRGDSGPIDPKHRFSRRNLLRRLAGQTEDRPGASSLGFDAGEREADRLVRDGRYADALVCFDRMIEREPAHREALRNRGWCLWMLDRQQEARETWRLLLDAYPEDHVARLYTGLSYAREDRVQEAMDAWREYRDYRKVKIMRQINLALFEEAEGEALDGPKLADRIEKAIDEQDQADRNN